MVRSKTNWKKILEYVSNKNIGDLITRKDLLGILQDPGINSVEPSRCLLTDLGVLEIQSRGVYVKLRNIKPTWNMFKLEALVRSGWRSWFLRLD